MIENKHYIRIDSDGYIIHGFTDAFEQPLLSDICINDKGGRQFALFGEQNPKLFSSNGVPLYKYGDGKVIKSEKIDIGVLKSHKILELHKSCEQAIYEGFEYDGYIFEYDLKDQSRFQSVMIAIHSGLTGEIQWATKTGEIVSFTEKTFPNLFNTSLIHLQTNIGKSRILENNVELASAKEDIEAIHW